MSASFRVRALLAAALGAMLPGCLFGPSREDELARIAKDWCQTIRASQVIPVYPLTEDLRPGDVFLVTRTIDEDQAVYEDKGYLPLDVNLARLDVKEALKSASCFQHPIGNALDGSIWPSSRDAWQTMSRVAFPSYSVSVDRQTGLQLALPIQAVPVALSAMRAETGSASVSLSGAYTYGLDAVTARAALAAWFAKRENRDLVSPIARAMQEEKTLWLRVISRVYLVQRVTVDVATEESAGANLGAGVGMPGSTPLDPSKSVADRVRDAVRDTPSVAGGAGGRIQFVSAGARSVTLDEEFARPLVVGYLAFQVGIDQHGQLLSGIAPTLQVLEGSEPAGGYGFDESATRIQAWLDADARNKAELKQYLADLSALGGDTGVTQLLSYLEQNAEQRRAVIDRFEIP